MSPLEKLDRRSFVVGAAATLAVRGLEPSPLFATSSSEKKIPGIWGTGQLFAFSALDGTTDYADSLIARSTDDPVGVRVELPGKAVVDCGERLTGEIQITNDMFQVTTEIGTIRGAFVDAYHLLIEGPCRISDVGEALRFETGEGHTLLGVRTHFDPKLLEVDIQSALAKRQRWIIAQRIPSGLSQRRRLTLLKALSVMKGQVNSPEGIIRHRWTTPDRWPHRDLWLWDSVFHAMGWRHVDAQVARDALESVFDGQRSDGFIPHQLSPTKSSSVTQPPLLAFGVKQLAGSQGDRTWVDRHYSKLARYLQWDFEHRVKPDAAAHWFIDPDPLSRSGGKRHGQQSSIRCCHPPLCG